MSLRRSGRLNPAMKSKLNNEAENSFEDHVDENNDQLQQKNPEKESLQDGQLNNSEVEKVPKEPKKETVNEAQEKVEENSEVVILEEMDVQVLDNDASKNTSATVKALNTMEMGLKEKLRRKKSGKIPMALKRKTLNAKLGKLLMPKSALILLHEFKPNCVYKVQEQPGCIPPSFYAQVLYNNEVIGSGQGLSKSHAKNSAAENAIKSIVSKTMTKPSVKAGQNNNSGNVNDRDNEDTPENLPWAGLASFAIYKMFSEWQCQGTELLSRSVTKQKIKHPNTPNMQTKKELPPNANELHPAVVLNMVYPGLTAVEVERENGPKCRVKMQYIINGEVFSGVGGNKKDAKKEAAKAVLEGLYGLTYPQ